MIVLQTFLALAAIFGFLVDVRAILNGDKRLALISLGVIAVLLVSLVAATWQTARVTAENKTLTDAQARAQRLVDTWTTRSRRHSTLTATAQAPMKGSLLLRPT